MAKEELTQEEKEQLAAEYKELMVEFKKYKEDPVKWQVEEGVKKSYECIGSMVGILENDGIRLDAKDIALIRVCLAYIPGLAVDTITKIAKFQRMMLKEDMEAEMLQRMTSNKEVN